MVNKIAKGRRIEREFARILESKGYEVYRPIWNRYGKKDVFLFDIVAIKNAEPIRLVQVKSNISDFYKARVKIRSWANGKKDIDAKFELVCKTREGWRYWCIYKGKEKEIKLLNADDI